MITINHGLSAYVCARTVMPALKKHSAISERSLGWAFLLGAALPDADILSKLLLGRAEYFSGVWYGHRAASHSLLGGLLMALLVAALLYRPLASRREGGSALAAYLWLTGGLWIGTMIHLFGDFFTPGWSMPIFWPAVVRFGSYSHIGWFTPYLLWLFMTTLFIAAGLHALARWKPQLNMFLASAAWLLYAVASWRWIHFVLISRYHSRGQWAEFQHDLLPELLITPINHAVSAAWYWMTG